MIDETLFNKYKNALEVNADLVESAVISLESQLANLQGETLTNALNLAYTKVVKQFGEIAGRVALDFYKKARLAVVSDDDFMPTVQNAFNATYLAEDVENALQNDNPLNSAMSALGGQAVQRVNGYADETIIQNAITDPLHPKWALVSNAGACEWCLMLAGLGFNFNAKGNIARHSRCKCATVVDFEAGNEGLKDYNPAGIAERFRDIENTIFGEKPYWEQWSELPASEKAKYKGKTDAQRLQDWKRKRILAEARTRDREWLRTGKPPAEAYENKKLEEEIKNNRPYERESALRLARHGICPFFVVDHKGEAGARIGLADLSGGNEIKSLLSASSKSTISKHIERTSKKADAKRLYFDNTQNNNLSDREVIELIAKIRRFKRGDIYVLTHDDTLIKVYRK